MKTLKVAGGQAATTKRRETATRLLPAKHKKTTRVKMPNVTTRLQKVFGRKVVSNKTMKRIVDDSRGTY